jgi:hypothetical protein
MELSFSWEAVSCSATQDVVSCYEARRFISVFTRALHWSIFWARLIQSTLPSYLSYSFANIQVLFQVTVPVMAYRVKEKHGDISYVVRLEVLTAVAMKHTIFWDIIKCSPTIPINIMSPSMLAAFFTRVHLLSCFATVKMETMRSSETFANFKRTTQCYTQEDRTLYLLP